MIEAFSVGLGAIFGAIFRWQIAIWAGSGFSLISLMAVNLLGSFLLGLVYGLYPDGRGLYLPLGVGFCGSLTTFSTLELELYRLIDEGKLGFTLGYLGVQLIAGLFLLYLGINLSKRLV